MLKIVGKTVDTGVEQVIWTSSLPEGFNTFTLSLRNLELVYEGDGYLSISLSWVLSLAAFGFPPVGVTVSDLKIPTPRNVEEKDNTVFKNHESLLYYFKNKMVSSILPKIAEAFAESVHKKILRARMELNRAKQSGTSISVNLEQLLKQVTVDVMRESGGTR